MPKVSRERPFITTNDSWSTAALIIRVSRRIIVIHFPATEGEGDPLPALARTCSVETTLGSMSTSRKCPLARRQWKACFNGCPEDERCTLDSWAESDVLSTDLIWTSVV